ncbi:MAG: hypothetical protein H7249_04475 [Chitinophagaceae bacterium]|nr:hypothetical protein [Oligoflexus sp.]
MSATTPPAKREHRHTGIRHHATQPHGILLIAAIIFVMAWGFWTFFLASPATVPVP